ncbi:lysis protein [Morganella morganii]|uniref:lysis protein n=1 Tax=Morganella morganii TaxID=582 RepID=UPI000DE753F4|nr:lysis protein [Morganella morganii]SSN07471.1 bacteriophage lysis protein [Klebsiella pneumoniae]EJG2207304.1 lysis protein [Morganella morganii]MBT0380375.1 lysis protein [Morganella morganii subsp. morganii]MBT0440618.1 lysis protein [Morganella morganii subsp. morganii]MBV7311823.1 lysis protein [Morganella morganii]
MNWKEAVIAALFITAAWWVYDTYRDNQQLKADNKTLSGQLAEQVAINKDYQERAQKLHELDIRHTQELANAKTEIDRLRIAADRNPERVYIKASCPKTGSVTTTGMDDAATARPDDTAVQNYWLLRERIAESEQMIKGLQDYVIQECLK